MPIRRLFDAGLIRSETIRHKVFRVGPQLLHRVPDGRVPTLGLKNIGKPDAPVRADATERKIAGIHATPDQWPRDAQYRRCVLR